MPKPLPLHRFSTKCSMCCAVKSKALQTCVILHLSDIARLFCTPDIRSSQTAKGTFFIPTVITGSPVAKRTSNANRTAIPVTSLSVPVVNPSSSAASSAPHSMVRLKKGKSVIISMVAFMTTDRTTSSGSPVRSTVCLTPFSGLSAKQVVTSPRCPVTRSSPSPVSIG